MKYCAVDACAPCQAMRESECRLAEAEALVERLKHEQCRLKSDMNSAHDPLTHWLPLEVKSQIFILCMPTFSVTEYTAEGRCNLPSKAVGVLSSVCTGWRDTARSTPQLWNVLCIVIPSRYLASGSMLQGIEAHLNRSGDLPLIIQIEQNWDPSLVDSHPSEYEMIFDALNRHSHRWHSLSLDVSHHIWSRLEGSTFVGAPKLDTLRIRLDGGGHSSETGFKLAHSRPSPSTVTIRGFHVNAIHIDWGAVTRLDVDYLSVADCVNILRHAPRLEQLQNEIPANDHNDPLEERYNTTTHKMLHTWDLRCLIDPAQIQILFDRLTLPSLKSMSLAASKPFNSLKRLITRSSCHLTHFKLANAFAGNRELISLLWMMPDIVDLHLGISHYSCTQELFELLGNTAILPYRSDEGIAFLPRLEKFYFGNEWQPNASPPWSSIPAWFPHPLAEPNLQTCRPLSSVHIRVDVKITSLSELEICVIERDTVPKLLDVVERGHDLAIVNTSRYLKEWGRDFLGFCQEYHDLHDDNSGT